MTDPNIPPEAPVVRASTSVTLRVVESVAATIKHIIVGAAFFVPGIIWLLKEINGSEPIHRPHIYMSVGLMVLGGIAIDPPFGKQLSGLVVQFFPNGLPIIGGRRNSDPPAPPPTQPPTSGG